MEYLKKLFMPDRQIFMAGVPEGTSLEGQKPAEKKQEGGEEGKVDATKQEGGRVVGAQVRALGQLGAEELDSSKKDKKDKVDVNFEAQPFKPEDIARISRGLPEVALAGNEAKVTKIKEQFKANQKRDMNEHGDNQYFSETGDYEYVLLYDGTKKPPERLFKSKDKKEAAKEDPEPTVGEMLKKPYAELPPADAEYKKYSAMLRGKVKNHGDAQSYIDANDMGFVLLKDDNAKEKNGLRVFKGTPV